MRREQNDRANVKWAHPELADCWGVSSFEIVDKLTDTSISVEDRLEFRKTTEVPNAAREQLLASRPDLSAHAQWLEYTVPGCPEEPNTPAHVTVRMPSDKSGGSLPVIFWVNGGALLMCDPKAFPLEELSLRHNAIVVATIYRTALEGKYPAAINDLHAAYQWVVGHAEELGADSDRIVVTGTSSGGHLSLALGFRLKRYGYKPRGIVANDPICDDRAIYPSQKFEHKSWGAHQEHRSDLAWLGEDNYNLPTLSPEAFPNRATVEECIGYPPTFIHLGENDPERDAGLSFAQKLLAANVFTEIHEWAGSAHAAFIVADPKLPIKQRYDAVFQGNIADCLKYDFRRSWLEDH